MPRLMSRKKRLKFSSDNYNLKLTNTMKILMMRTFDDCGVHRCGVHRAQGTIDLYALEFDTLNEMVMIIFFENVEVTMKV